jgi:hypothetical protein
MKIKMSLLIIVMLLLVTGCATTSIMRNASIYDGKSKTYNDSFDRVLKAARESVTQSGLEVEEVTQLDHATWSIIGNKGVTGWSWGERVRVIVQKKSEAETLVRVLTKRKHPTNVTATWDFSPEIFSNIESNLQRF